MRASLDTEAPKCLLVFPSSPLIFSHRMRIKYININQLLIDGVENVKGQVQGLSHKLRVIEAPWANYPRCTAAWLGSSDPYPGRVSSPALLRMIVKMPTDCMAYGSSTCAVI